MQRPRVIYHSSEKVNSGPANKKLYTVILTTSEKRKMEHEESGDQQTGGSAEAHTSLNNVEAVDQKPTGPSGYVKGKAKIKTHFTVEHKKAEM